MKNRSIRHPEGMPSMVYADANGQIFDLPGLKMIGRSGHEVSPLQKDDLIPLPEGSELFVLPGTLPLGWDADRDEVVVFDGGQCGLKGPVQAVAAFMAPGYTQTAMAPFFHETRDHDPLPLFSYTAVGWWRGRFWVAGFRSDPDPRQDFRSFRPRVVREKTLKKLKRFRSNRLVQHLGRCSLTYGCPAARNFFMERWEAPIPTSPACNARCIGCISHQPKGGPPATQDRIRFVPSTEEVVELAVSHIARAGRGGIVSFGQGCEGEPLLQWELLVRSIRKIRQRTGHGTVNLNTNASVPDAVQPLVEAGLDSMRISMNSSRKRYYEAYYRPKGFIQDDVLRTWKTMKQLGKFVSLNLFILPGLTDEMEEIDRLSGLIDRFGLDLIQLRNHNIDPDWYLNSIGYRKAGRTVGIKGMVRILKERFPWLRFGYFNPRLNGGRLR